MSHGTNGAILRVDLTAGSISTDSFDDGFYRRYPGGKALAAYHLLREFRPGGDPLGPENLLVLATGLLTGGLAALMSTLDSQLLTMASMIGLDFGKRKAAPVWLHRLIVLAIGFAGYLLALRPPQTILDFVNRTSFTGLAVLAPVVLGGLYWRRANRYGALAGILAGEAMTVLSFFRVVQVPGVLPVIPVLAVTSLVFAVVSLLTRSPGENAGLAAQPAPAVRRGRLLPAILVFAGLFVLANDFWAWNRRPVLWAGLPLWVWYYILLGVLLAGAYALMLGRKRG